jgi:hypothetical protein
MTRDLQKIIKQLPLLPSLSALSTCCKVSEGFRLGFAALALLSDFLLGLV